MRKKVTLTLDQKIVKEIKAVFPDMPFSRIVERGLKQALDEGRSWLV